MRSTPFFGLFWHILLPRQHEVDPETRHRLIVDENVRLQIEHLQEYPFVASAMKAGKLRVHGWVYDIGSGEIRIIASPDE